QPSPFKGSIGGIWRLMMLLIGAVIFLSIAFSAASNHAPDFQQRYSFAAGSPDATVLSEPFELKGRTSAAEVEIKTDLSQNWAFFNIALINQDTGDAFNVGREVSSYTGSDSDGTWSEGGNSESVTIPSVPPGNYRLLVEPEMDAPAGLPSSIATRTRNSPRGVATSINSMNYEVS